MSMRDPNRKITITTWLRDPTAIYPFTEDRRPGPRVEYPRPIRVLIVDDRHDDALREVQEIERIGFTVAYAVVSTREQLERELYEEPDVMLVDHDVSGITLPDALAALRERYPDAHAILVSGKVTDEAAFNCLAHGLFTYVLKDRIKRLGWSVYRAIVHRDILRQHRDTETRLAREREFIKTLLDRSPWIIAVTNRDGAVIYQSRATEKMLGYGPGELIGKNILDLVVRDQANEARAVLASLSTRPSGEVQARFGFHTKRGSKLPSTVFLKIYAFNDRTLGLIVYARNIGDV